MQSIYHIISNILTNGNNITLQNCSSTQKMLLFYGFTTLRQNALCVYNQQCIGKQRTQVQMCNHT